MTGDYDDILDGNVDEVKKAIRDLEDPDYSELLELEEEGKDRKTIKEFLESRIEDIEEQTEEVVEEIEEETAGGFLGDFSREKVLAGGVVAGVVIGLLVGLAFTGQGATTGSQEEVRNSLQEFYELSGNTPESVTVSRQNGMFYAQVNITREIQNGTQVTPQSFYVSPDGDLLFPEIRSPLITSPYNLDQLIERARAQQQQPSGNTTQ